MRRAGRINLGLVGVVFVVLLAGVFLLASRNSPEESAGAFMSALAKGDANKLVEYTYLRGKDPAALKSEYEFATQKAGKYYTFVWRIKGAKMADDKTAAVQLSVRRNAAQSSAYDENFDLPMVKQDGKWLVDVPGINSTMYPGLPR